MITICYYLLVWAQHPLQHIITIERAKVNSAGFSILSANCTNKIMVRVEWFLGKGYIHRALLSSSFIIL